MRIEDWGQIDYLDAEKKQLELVEMVASGGEDIIVFCSHPPVVSLGRATKDGDVFGFDGPVIEVSRGGRATYHGPNQLVVYPIINLKTPRIEVPQKDLHALLRALENFGVELLKGYGVEATAHEKAQQVDADEEADATGVWVKGQKIASVGIAVRKWVSYHGIAINILDDPKAFKGLHPCGFKTEIMTNLEKLTDKQIDMKALKVKAQEILIKQLEPKDK